MSHVAQHRLAWLPISAQILGAFLPFVAVFAVDIARAEAL